MPIFLEYALILRNWKYAQYQLNILLIFNIYMVLHLLFGYHKASIWLLLRGKPQFGQFLLSNFDMKLIGGIEVLGLSAWLCSQCDLN